MPLFTVRSCLTWPMCSWCTSRSQAEPLSHTGTLCVSHVRNIQLWSLQGGTFFHWQVSLIKPWWYFTDVMILSSQTIVWSIYIVLYWDWNYFPSFHEMENGKCRLQIYCGIGERNGHVIRQSLLPLSPNGWVLLTVVSVSPPKWR